MFSFQDCISCCSHAYCNDLVPTNLTTALLYSSSITNSEGISSFKNGPFRLLTALICSVFSLRTSCLWFRLQFVMICDIIPDIPSASIVCLIQFRLLSFGTVFVWTLSSPVLSNSYLLCYTSLKSLNQHEQEIYHQFMNELSTKVICFLTTETLRDYGIFSTTSYINTLSHNILDGNPFKNCKRLAH